MLTLLAAGLPTLGHAQSVSYAAPIVITKGGTYTGNYQSLSSGTPCVRIATNDPVILDGCTFSGAGNLIEAGEGADLTVRNCTGQGLAPTVNNQAPGRFLDTYRAKNLTIEHNAFTQTSGIVVNRWSGSGQAGQTLTVRYNRVRNIDGRWLNGGSTRSSFLILNTVVRLAGVDVSYNEVINAPNESLVEDN
ncbi:MAG: glycosyl hydrolase, partial [Hymenobacter sp.]